jgi:hypothetical protein
MKVEIFPPQSLRPATLRFALTFTFRRVPTETLRGEKCARNDQLSARN